MLADSGLVWVANFCVAAATIGCVYTLIAAALTLRFAQRTGVGDGTQPSVTVLKPLCGREPDLLGRLLAFGHQHYDGPVQIVFGSQDRSDPAIDVVKRLQGASPDLPVDVAVDPRAYGTNRKVSNLINMATLARHEVIVMSDSDIEVGPNYLTDVVAELQKPGVGAVTCLYHGATRGGIWSRPSAMSINTYFLSTAVLAGSMGLCQPCLGGTSPPSNGTPYEIRCVPSLAD